MEFESLRVLTSCEAKKLSDRLNKLTLENNELLMKNQGLCCLEYSLITSLTDLQAEAAKQINTLRSEKVEAYREAEALRSTVNDLKEKCKSLNTYSLLTLHL